MTHWQSEREEECTHNETEEATVSLVGKNELIDKFSVKRCSECGEIRSIIGEEEDQYHIPMESDSDCSHGYDSVEVVRYQFEYDNGENIWETVTRECSLCGSRIERLNINLVGKPEESALI